MWEMLGVTLLKQLSFQFFGSLRLPCANWWTVFLLIFFIIFIGCSIFYLDNSLNVSTSLVYTDTVSNFVRLSHHFFLDTDNAGKYECFRHLSFDPSDSHQLSVLSLLCVIIHYSMYVIQVLFSTLNHSRVGFFEIFEKLMMKSLIKDKESGLLAIEGWHHITILF